jgi:hypothetical protein
VGDRGSTSHETGFGGIWDVSKYSFRLPKTSNYNYQK